MCGNLGKHAAIAAGSVRGSKDGGDKPFERRGAETGTQADADARLSLCNRPIFGVHYPRDWRGVLSGVQWRNLRGTTIVGIVVRVENVKRAAWPEGVSKASRAQERSDSMLAGQASVAMVRGYWLR